MHVCFQIQQLVFLVYVCNFFLRFLINPKKDKDLRKWAVEGLSYLTLDADVKEELVEDTKALHALFDLAKVTIFQFMKQIKF